MLGPFSASVTLDIHPRISVGPRNLLALHPSSRSSPLRGQVLLLSLLPCPSSLSSPVVLLMNNLVLSNVNPTFWLIQLCVCPPVASISHRTLWADEARTSGEAGGLPERLWPQNINDVLPRHSRIKSLFPPWISSILKYLISKGGGGRVPWKDRNTREKRNPFLWLGVSAKWA